jgi:hypothetical protein
MWTALLLLLLAEPATEKTWWILFADEKGGYWVDASSGKTKYDPKLERKKPEKAKPDDGRSQFHPPPPVRRYRDASVTAAKGVTVRMVKYCLQLQRDGKRELLTDAMCGRHPALRPDGKVLAYLRWDRTSRLGGKARIEDLVLLDLETRKETVLVESSVLHGATWSPDGKKIAVGAIGKVDLIDVKSGKTIKCWKLEEIDKRLWNHGPTHLLFHPGGEWIATRCTFLGGREAGTSIFGDHKLILLSEKETRVLDLPKTTCEGPIRAKVANEDRAEGAEEAGDAEEPSGETK